MARPEPPRRSTGDKLAAAATSPGPTALPHPRNAATPSNGRTGLTKYTVHLDSRHNRALKMLALDAGTTASKVVRGLIDLAADDPAFRMEAIRRANAPDE